MKMSLKIIVLLQFLYAFTYGKSTLSIQKALEKKWVKTQVVCRGGLSVNYKVISFSKDSLVIVVPAGWRMNSNAGEHDYQDILVTHDQMMVLRPKETKTFEIIGYCCEADKSGPIKGVPYTQGKMADTNLVKLALYLNAHPNDHNTEQYAVWAISNNKPTANITNSNDSLALTLRNFVAGIKREPLPWFTLLKKAYISPTGEVTEYPVKLVSTLHYDLSHTEYSYFYILDSHGNKTGIMIEQWLVPDGKNEYPVNLDLRQFKKGAYKMVLATKENKLVEKEFEI